MLPRNELSHEVGINREAVGWTIAGLKIIGSREETINNPPLARQLQSLVRPMVAYRIDCELDCHDALAEAVPNDNQFESPPYWVPEDGLGLVKTGAAAYREWNLAQVVKKLRCSPYLTILLSEPSTCTTNAPSQLSLPDSIAFYSISPDLWPIN